MPKPEPLHHIPDLTVVLHGGNYPMIYHGAKKVAAVEWQMDRRRTIATALIMSIAPEMLVVLQKLLDWKSEEFELNEPVNGGDAVEFLAKLKVEAHVALSQYLNDPRIK